jgi:hypothetical protein
VEFLDTARVVGHGDNYDTGRHCSTERSSNLRFVAMSSERRMSARCGKSHIKPQRLVEANMDAEFAYSDGFTMAWNIRN